MAGFEPATSSLPIKIYLFYQNKDGTLTAAGRNRYGLKPHDPSSDPYDPANYGQKGQAAAAKAVQDKLDSLKNDPTGRAKYSREVIDDYSYKPDRSKAPDKEKLTKSMDSMFFFMDKIQGYEESFSRKNGYEKLNKLEKVWYEKYKPDRSESGKIAVGKAVAEVCGFKISDLNNDDFMKLWSIYYDFD